MPSKADLAKIHIAKKELGLTDEVYRDILSMRFGVNSAAKLTDRQATVLLNTFKAKGWKERKSKKASTSPMYIDAQMRKVVAMWITLGQKSVLRNSSDQALQAYVKRMTKRDNLKWCNRDDLYLLIEGLKSWGTRNGVEFE
jgi:phage gp16-like protein